MLIYFIPFLYTFKTRLNGLSSKIAWFLTYLFPSLLVFFSLNFTTEEIFSSFFYYFISVSIIYASYELGYLYNDAELTKAEVNPTLRLTKVELDLYESSKPCCYIVKLCYIFFSLIFLFYQSSFFFGGTLLSSVSIFLLYIVYSSIRNRWNIPLYSLLVFFRYYGPFVFLVTPFALFLFWVIYPLVMTVEFASKKKYNFKVLSGLEPDFFRFIVYSFFLIAVFFKCFFYDCSLHDRELYGVFVLVFYFFIYRSLIYIFFKRSKL